MKFFDTDWSCIFRWLAVWEELSVPARSHYLLAAPSHAQTVSPEGYGNDLEFVLKVGLVEPVATGRLKPSATSVPFRALMAQLAKHPLFEQKPTPELLDSYLVKHYLRQESDFIRSSSAGTAWDSPARPQSFLDQTDARGWERAYLTHLEVEGALRSSWSWSPKPAAPPKRTWFPDTGTVEAAKCLVRHALETVQPVPLLSLPGCLPERLRPSLEPALKACLRFMLLYPALRPESLQAVIGLCPTAVYHLSRPAATPPPAEPCANLVGTAFLLEDMTRVLVEAATGECRINRSDYGQRFFKVIEDKLRDEFVPLPAWMQEHHNFEDRLHDATTALKTLKLAEDKELQHRRVLVATAAGRKWLARPAVERLRALLFEVRRRNGDDYDYYLNPLTYMPGEFQFSMRGTTDFDPQAWLSSIWRQTPVSGCVALHAFLDYHARMSHPLVSPAIPDSKRPQSISLPGDWRRAAWAENIEDSCREVLHAFFWKRLVPLGCVETTAREDGRIWFRLSSAGQYFSGQTDQLAYGQAAADHAVIVQPNFDIVFLHPNLNAEVELAPLAERVGKQVGTLFRLTRHKVILAASQGTTAEAMLATLGKHSGKPLPANVVEEIRSWFGVCRPLTTRRSILIEAGDRETALRVQHLLGSRCAALSGTLLEWRGTVLDPKLRKKLTEQGLFLDSA